MDINIPQAIGAIGALGTASFALVDASKFAANGGASNTGFYFIEGAVKRFIPDATRSTNAGKTGSLAELLDILHGNWINGMALADQKAVAKSMLKLRLTPGSAEHFAAAADVDKQVLAEVADCMLKGEQLNTAQSNVLGRFDLALTATLDASYQRAEQSYRNTSRVYAMAVAILLAFFGGWTLSDFHSTYLSTGKFIEFLLCGLIATPLAPISKDLTSALAAAVKMAQSVTPRK